VGKGHGRGWVTNMEWDFKAGPDGEGFGGGENVIGGG